MGNICSKKTKDASEKAYLPILTELGLNFSLDDWRNFHKEGSIEQYQAELENLGVDLKKSQSFPKCLTRAVFICCNTYTKPEYSLGVGPLNDAITVANYMKKIGFNIYFIHNSRSIEYMKYFKNFLQKTTEYLFIYYIGHSACDDAKNEDGLKIKDEALIFDDNYLFDDKLVDDLINSKKSESCKVYLLSDCCHSSHIYNLQASVSSGKKFPPNIMVFSTVRQSETVKETSVGGTDYGIFTFYFFKILSQNDSITPNKMESQIDQYLKRFQQNFVVYSTTESLLNEPIFK